MRERRESEPTVDGRARPIHSPAPTSKPYRQCARRDQSFRDGASKAPPARPRMKGSALDQRWLPAPARPRRTERLTRASCSRRVLLVEQHVRPTEHGARKRAAPFAHRGRPKRGRSRAARRTDHAALSLTDLEPRTRQPPDVAHNRKPVRLPFDGVDQSPHLRAPAPPRHAARRSTCSTDREPRRRPAMSRPDRKPQPLQ